MTPAQQLYNLPEPIQVQLLAIVREALGMSAGEKGHAAAMFATVAQHFAIKGSDEQIPGALMVSALAVLLKAANQEATESAEVI
ncbi:hypothetical protein [Nocardioides sp. cx-173]|uniref:hypothetical protein n=1 Tax=Nocardioides sp. cx-173 TaxID=2898796 RepID=UPI001E392DE6|nr:hypothetical protein [Nocardioides sp. cx-173]MCD4525240.1 hypothetical protein [Nocardioides sp. cx-173]UGB40957.1 hypothetical protein LQ940_16465 [Nocardioides sp. cx-173]